jgi:DNA-binding transcriptional MerR regulator
MFADTVEEASATNSKLKGDTAFRTIGEVSENLQIPTHVLRFWETKFTQIKPVKRRGGHRYYRPSDVELIKEIRSLLYDKGFTIKGAQKFLKDNKKGIVSPEQVEQAVSNAISQSSDSGKSEIDLLKSVILGLKAELQEIRELLKA